MGPNKMHQPANLKKCGWSSVFQHPTTHQFRNGRPYRVRPRFLSIDGEEDGYEENSNTRVREPVTTAVGNATTLTVTVYVHIHSFDIRVPHWSSGIDIGLLEFIFSNDVRVQV
ncbi:hypothetical protein BJ138DRAFT_1105439 [Hygrophoropsis aurantiaca]|uniref:Uncharacterized protein n=1 Tax=Hygrophoropsis aurantiaca TaxID=72124 RepID=A0ACB7ZZ92_9AGAM|nr:hypothetical protein BJ138DRAFT_1105439 [Hygrophoropsis aurantiaca]